jgi:hypothetical protein
MTTYPDSVVQNMTAGNTAPPDFQLIAKENWGWFGTLQDCQAGLGMIDAVCDSTKMLDAQDDVGGMYAQYVYLDPNSDIRCRIVRATARDEEGVMAIAEYPSAIFDRDTVPLPMIDTYAPGEPHKLEVLRIGPKQGTLRWVKA